MPRMNMVEAIRAGLRQEMERDETVLLMGEDIGHLGGVFRATDGLQQFFGSQRVIDTPLAETLLPGRRWGWRSPAGARWSKSSSSVSPSNVSTRIDQQISRLRFRTRGSHTAPLVIRSPFGGGVRTPEFHSDSMEHTFAQSSGLKVGHAGEPL